MERTKAGFRALREQTGLTQEAVAEQAGVTALTVKRWESPDNGWAPSEAAWRALDRAAAAQAAAVDAALGAVYDAVAATGDLPRMVELPYWRDQAHYDERGRDRGDYGVANADSRAVVEALRRAGVDVRLVYPGYDDAPALDAAARETRG